MDAICLVIAGMVRATLPTGEFTLAWEHSVEKTRWEEHYRVQGDRLALIEAGVAGSGAGMDPASGAQFADGRWTWRPNIVPLAELRLAGSQYARDYEFCWAGRCANLDSLLGTSPRSASVDVKACRLSEAAATTPRDR